MLLWGALENEVDDWKARASGASNAMAAHARQSIRAADLALDTIIRYIETDGATTPLEFKNRISASPDIAGVIARYITAVPQISNVAMVDSEGDLINVSGRAPLPPINISDRAHFQEAMRPGFEGTVIGAPVLSRADGKWVIFLTRSISAPGPLGGEKVKLGVVILGIPVSHFQEFYQAISPGNYSAMLLFRRDGLLLARNPPDDSRLAQSYIELPAFKTGLRDGQPQSPFLPDAGGLSFKTASLNRIVSVGSLSDLGLVAVVTIRQDLYLMRWYHGVRIVVPIVGLICFVVLILTAAVWRLLSNQEKHGMTIRQVLTDLQQSQARLRDKTRMLDLTLEHMDQGIAMITPDGMVPVCNRRALDLLELPDEVMMGQTTITEIMNIMRNRHEYDTVDPKLRSLVEQAETFDLPEVYTRKRPNGLTLEIRSRKMPDGGIIRTITDVTARTQMEAELRQAHRMEAIGQLTAGIAHDFNNVLGIIVGNIELSSELVATDPQASGRHLDEALEATTLAAELVSGLLAFSRMTSLAIEPTNLVALVDITLPMLRQAVAGDMEVVVVCQDQCWPVEVDVRRLQSALMNLARNARAASPKGSCLQIRLKNVEVPLRSDKTSCQSSLVLEAGDYVCLEVEDRGAGMSASTRAHIFEPFFTTRSVGDGIGLGMSMVLGTLQQMGGTVEVESTEGKGTTVSLYLKRAI
jgi:signal transduction histidine kinase